MKSTGVPVSSTPSCGKRAPHPGSEVEELNPDYRKSLSTVSLLRDFVDRLKEPVYWLFILFKYM
ncbi:hypothetical protein [Halalkalibacter oceani]|uniref:hypothetical protein n=1 Tax=Halalkalibacter oceani TaxID=1653776 RepID=UPI0033927986